MIWLYYGLTFVTVWAGFSLLLRLVGRRTPIDLRDQSEPYEPTLGDEAEAWLYCHTRSQGSA